jgi:DNA invertase Pin-like site-specific DNA recombinase
MEKVSGAEVTNRAKLALLMEVIGTGDTVIVCKLDRLSRDTLHMLELVRDIGAKGAGFKSLAEPWCDTTTAAGELMLTVFAGVAQFERKRLKERQREGIERAKATGVFKGGKVRFDTSVIQQKRAEGMTPTEIARHLGCNPATVFRALRAVPSTDRAAQMT